MFINNPEVKAVTNKVWEWWQRLAERTNYRENQQSARADHL